ncbi:hypothetical protein ACEWY4_028014 [Coilia grayii]|uniref:C1q domain-containing protein n=1 Tax=Coilia grayii TaxID=363190 RepID=A0ABD1IQB1_9TELE
MRAAISLLVLLFSMCGAQTRSTQTEVQTESQSTGAAAAAAEVSTQLDVSAELKELRDMVVELRVLLTVTQNELQNTKAEMKTEVENLKKENAALETGLAATETDVEELKMDSAAHEQELAALKTRLAASETGIDDLKVENAAQEAELTALKTRLAATETENEVENLKKENAAQEAELTAVKTRLAATETEVDNLERITEKSKVAFSAGLTDSGYLVAGNTELNLVFSKIITNAGQAYSSTSGFFTAPVRGVYYFRFTVLDAPYSRHMGIKMYKNGQYLMGLYDYDTDGQNSYLSSGLTLQLEVGDEINLRIPAGYRLYDSVHNHSTFSGFLLFPL